MRPIPLYRRVLPWIFVAIFLVLAPILIFLTSGYRYNTKKGQIESNGTLIVDSIPKGARISLDDQDTGQTTPFTFQNIAPGPHALRLLKNQYRPWEKSLDVHAGQVTFANQIWLWRDSQPLLALNGPIRVAASDPKQDGIALLFDYATSSLGFWKAGAKAPSLLRLPDFTSSTPAIIRWRDDGLALLVNGLHPGDNAAWTTWRESGGPVERLPDGIYHWSDQELLGVDERSQFHLQPRSGAFDRETLAQQTVDTDDGFTLETMTSTQALQLKELTFPKKTFALPQGSWRFGAREKSYIVLQDRDRWLALNPSGGQSVNAEELTGDFPRWLPNSSYPSAIFLNRNEIWSWSLGGPPSLLWRQSQPIVQALWHRSGTSIFIAADDRVFALELDERGGRIVTELAQFEHVYDLGIVGTSLYVAAVKDGIRGLWALNIE